MSQPLNIYEQHQTLYQQKSIYNFASNPWGKKNLQSIAMQEVCRSKEPEKKIWIFVLDHLKKTIISYKIYFDKRIKIERLNWPIASFTERVSPKGAEKRIIRLIYT